MRCVGRLCGGPCEAHNAPSVWEDGGLVMSWLAGPGAFWACEGVTWLGQRGVSPALCCWIGLWRAAALHPAAKQLHSANHSLVFGKSTCIQSLPWLFFALICNSGDILQRENPVSHHVWSVFYLNWWPQKKRLDLNKRDVLSQKRKWMCALITSQLSRPCQQVFRGQTGRNLGTEATGGGVHNFHEGIKNRKRACLPSVTFLPRLQATPVCLSGLDSGSRMLVC